MEIEIVTLTYIWYIILLSYQYHICINVIYFWMEAKSALLTSRLWISSWPMFSWVDRDGLTRISCPAGPKRTTVCGMANFSGANTTGGAATCPEDKGST